MPETEDHLKQVDALHAKIARALSEHRQSFGHNDEQFWSYCSCNENEPHVMEDGPGVPDPVEKRAFWATGVEIFAEHLAARAVDEVEEAGWVSPEEAKAREAAARREALLEAAQWFAHEDIDAFGASRESAQTYTVLVLADEAQRPGGPRFALAEPERDEEGGR